MSKIILLVALLLLLVGCAKENATGNVVLDVVTVTSISCEDSDAGLVKDIRGSVKVGMSDGTIVEESDKCISGLLIEYYCEGNKIENQNLRCDSEDVCKQGRCK